MLTTLTDACFVPTNCIVQFIHRKVPSSRVSLQRHHTTRWQQLLCLLGLLGRKDFAGIHDVHRINCGLDRAHQRQFCRVYELGHG